MTISGHTEGTRQRVVEFYWRPGCPFCAMLRRGLVKTDLPLREVNIWSDPKAAARVRSVAGGNETVPTVFVGTVALVNPSVADVRAAVREQFPDLATAAEPRKLRWPWQRAR
ncbi:MAG: NrdH-redoxin [Streptosporangiales bacterium]|nr:NrdH-redoxin [Streptosporangiales bacterium]